MTEHRILIASEFSKYPGPRYQKDGPFSGQLFRDKILIPALRNAQEKGDVITVVLDGVAGYGSSFLEEAFGGLIRAGIKPQTIQKHLQIVSESSRFQHHRTRALNYIKEEERRLQHA